MYTIKFHDQPKHDMLDVESCSINLTLEDYYRLPELSMDKFKENCKFLPRHFSEQVRNASKTFPAVWIYNPEWKLKNDDGTSEYIDDTVFWVIVCIDEKEGFYIAFRYYDIATTDDAYGSTVAISFPRHDTVYSLDDSWKLFLSKYFNQFF